MTLSNSRKFYFFNFWTRNIRDSFAFHAPTGCYFSVFRRLSTKTSLASSHVIFGDRLKVEADSYINSASDKDKKKTKTKGLPTLWPAAFSTPIRNTRWPTARHPTKLIWIFTLVSLTFLKQFKYYRTVFSFSLALLDPIFSGVGTGKTIGSKRWIDKAVVSTRLKK